MKDKDEETGASGLAPRTGRSAIPAADLGDVAMEQLEYLVEHSALGLHLGCSDCARYIAIRTTLLSVFE